MQLVSTRQPLISKSGSETGTGGVTFHARFELRVIVAIFRGVCDAVLYFNKNILCTSVQINLDELLSRGRSGWLIWAKYVINLLM